MKNKVGMLKALLLSVVMLTAAPCSYAAGAGDERMNAPQGIALDEEALTCVEAMLRQYVAWQNVEYSGKLRVAGLGISPTVKMYMENGRLIQISARVPLLGEVARIEIGPETILAVNKLKKTYCLESMQHLLSIYPGLISDLQSIFLGRVVIVGEGEYSDSNRMQMLMERSKDGDWLIFPKDQPAGGRIKYGYVVKENGRTADFYAAAEEYGYSATVNYTYPGTGIEMALDIKGGSKQYAGMLDFDSVKWGGSPMGEVNLGKYRRMGIEEFIRSIKF